MFVSVFVLNFVKKWDTLLNLDTLKNQYVQVLSSFQKHLEAYANPGNYANYYVVVSLN